MKQRKRIYQMALVTLCFSLGHLATWPLGHSLVSADVPSLIRYQGTAVDSQGVPLEGPYNLTFRLYAAATGGSAIWQEPYSNISLSKGHFTVLLGSVTSLTAMDWKQPCWLSVQVNSDPELSPRQQITSVPLAITAKYLDGPITTSGNNVGIGTTTPTAPLDVNGQVRAKATSLPALDITGSNIADVLITDNANPAILLRLTGPQAVDWQIMGHDTAGDFRLYSNKAAGGAGDYVLTVTKGGNVGIGTTTPDHILFVKENSTTDPVADSWAVHPCDRQHKKVLRTLGANAGYFEQVKAVNLYEWKREPLVSDEEAKAALGKERPTSAEMDAKKRDLAEEKARLPKYTTKRLGMVIDDANVPSEILTFNPDGTRAGIDLLAYIGYLHAALKEAAIRISALEARLDNQPAR